MADLSDNNSAQSIKIIGADSSGVEATPVGSTLDGKLKVNIEDTVNVNITNQFIPEIYDDIVITRDPDTCVITQTDYKLSGVIVATVIFERDANLNLTRTYRA